MVQVFGDEFFMGLSEYIKVLSFQKRFNLAPFLKEKHSGAGLYTAFKGSVFI